MVNALLNRGLIDQCRQQGETLQQALKEKFGDHPYVGDVRGRGLFRGVEIVQDRYTREPFDPNLGVNKQIKKSALEAGLICYPMGGTIDGQRGDHVLLAPPFIIEDDQVIELVEKLSIAVDKATDR